MKGDDRNTFSIFVFPLLVYSALFLHCSLSFSLSLSLSPSLHLDFSCQPVQTEGTWKAEEKIESAPLLTCTFYNLQVRHKEKIEYTGYRNAQAVLVLLLPWSLVCAEFARWYHAIAPCCTPPLLSFLIHEPQKFEGRREKGIEGMSSGKDNQGGVICSSSVGKLCLAFPCSWSHSSHFLFIM